MKKIIVYHDHCSDGITALYCALQSAKWAEAEHYPAAHSKPPDLERLKGAEVLMLDFAWKRPAMIEILKTVSSLQLYDHHVTAIRQLHEITKEIPDNSWVQSSFTLDKNRSGAGLAWDYLVGGPRPPLVDYVEDADLFRFALPHSREVRIACNLHPLTLQARIELMERSIEGIIEEGRPALAYHNRLVDDALRFVRRETIAGHNVPSICCPIFQLTSDLGSIMAAGEPFAAVWTALSDGRRAVSLRSAITGLDVSAIAEQFGGGGHEHAASYVLPRPRRWVSKVVAMPDRSENPVIQKAYEDRKLDRMLGLTIEADNKRIAAENRAEVAEFRVKELESYLRSLMREMADVLGPP